MPTLSLMPLQYIFEFKSVCDTRKTHILIAFHYECGNAATRREKYIKLYESVCVCRALRWSGTAEIPKVYGTQMVYGAVDCVRFR